MKELEWATRLLALATLLQTMELFQLRRSWQDPGVWSWRVLRKEYAAFPGWIRLLLSALLDKRGFAGVLFLRLAASLILLLAPVHASLLGILFLSTWLIAIRWRGTFNGGSDSMTAIVALGLWLASGPQAWMLRAGLGLIAVHLTLSYVLAGIAKARNPTWLSGQAAVAILKTPGYDAPPAALLAWLETGQNARYASWALLAFELGFPFAWLGPKFCLPFLLVGLIFHLLCFRVLGLSRFVFAWISAYPALYFWSARISA